MAESMPHPSLLPPDRDAELAAYRPVSALAIAGFAVAAFYAATVVIGGAAAFASHSPLLLGPLWCIGGPTVGALLCLAARWHIARSEGTRAGLALATWGWWLSIVVGLGYGAFYAAIYSSLRNEADDFTQKWLNLIKEGKIYHAFRLMQEPQIQAAINPDDEKGIRMRFDQGGDPMRAPPLTAFRRQEYVRAILEGGPETKFTPLGMREWDAAGLTREVRRAYRVETPLGEYELIVSVQGKTSTKGEFEGRVWSVRNEYTGVMDRKLTPRGQLLAGLRGQSQAFAQHWLSKVQSGQVGSAYLDLFDPPERPKVEQTFTARLTFFNALTTPPAGGSSGVAARLLSLGALVTPGWSLELYMPEYRERVAKAVLADERRLRVEDDAARKAIPTALASLFAPERGGIRFQGGAVDADCSLRPVAVWGERLQLAHDCQLAFPPYKCDAIVTVEGLPGYDDPTKEPAWRILKLEAVGAQDMSKGRPGMQSLPVPPPEQIKR
jgi:hypothetical protein